MCVLNYTSLLHIWLLIDNTSLFFIKRNVKKANWTWKMVEVTFITDLKNEIYQWGAELRFSWYIHSPFDEKEHNNFGNKTLDNDLINFQKLQKQPFSLLTRGLNLSSLKPIFCTTHRKNYFSFYWENNKAANFFINTGLAWRIAGSWLWSWYVLRKHDYNMRIIILYYYIYVWFIYINIS